MKVSSEPRLFFESPYYQKAVADPLQLVEPLGYDFLSSKAKIVPKVNKGELEQKTLFDKIIFKQLSNKKTASGALPEFLKVSEQQRKNTYLSANPLSIVTKTDPSIVEEMEGCFMPSISKSDKDTIAFVNSFHNISQEGLLSIGDFSLSKYFVFYDGDNFKNIMHVLKTLNEEFIEYNVNAIVGNCVLHEAAKRESQVNPQDFSCFERPEIQNRGEVDKYIKQIWDSGKGKDDMFGGLHFFIGDAVKTPVDADLLKEETCNLEYVQYYLYLVVHLLANSQSAIIRLRGTMRHKTTDLLFLYKLVFTKVTLVKPLGSNFISTEKYMICEGFVGENAAVVAEHLREHYHLLREFGEDKLLVNPKSLFRVDIQTHIESYNDSTVIRGVKELLESYLANSNLEIYPPKEPLLEKLNAANCPFLKELLQQLEREIPDAKKDEGAQEENKIDQTQTESKPVGGISMRSILNMKKEAGSKDTPQQSKNPKAKPKVDEEEELEKRMIEKFKEQERIREQNKKRKKEQREKGRKSRSRNAQDLQDNEGFSSRFELSDR